jgi:hypothetical protein
MEKPMASDERDRNFDRAMARHLPSAAASADAASSAAGTRSHRDSCPDAETLAAYHERSLLPVEMNSWKEHIVGCALCQEILAHLEATDAIPLPSAQEVEAFSKTKSQPAAASPSQPVAAAAPARVRSLRLVAGTRWRWLVPASAIAAGLLVWISLHENQPPALPAANEIKVAKNQEPPASLPSAGTGSQALESRPQLAPQKSDENSDKFIASRRVTPAETLKQSRPYAYSAKAVPKLPSKEEGKLQKDAGRGAAADQLLNEKRADLDAKSVDGALRQREEVQSQTQSDAVNAQLQNQANSNMPKVAGPAPLNQVANARKSEAAPAAAPRDHAASGKKLKAAAAAAPPPAPAAASDVVSGLSVGAASEMVMVVSDPTRIYAPGAASVWHAGNAGLIEFSPDGGHSWSRQRSGVIVDLLTGSAPSEKVCWIVGRVGAILLTTDGGAHWKLISSPLKDDLGGIQATDELHALIWNVQNKKRFSTSDGGLTWERLSP